MKKHLVILSMILAPLAARADFSSTMWLASDYIWRGTSQLSSPGPAIQGSIDYNDESGAMAGIWGSNSSATQGYEMDLYAGYNKAFGDVATTFMVYYYNFPRMTSYNTYEVTVMASYMGIKGSINYMPEFFNDNQDDTSSSMYFNLGYGYALNEKLTLNLGVGMWSFGDKDYVAFCEDAMDGGTANCGTAEDFMDYKVGIAYMVKDMFTTELAWTDTNRQYKDGAGEKQDIEDSAMTVTISKTF